MCGDINCVGKQNDGEKAEALTTEHCNFRTLKEELIQDRDWSRDTGLLERLQLDPELT